MSAAGPKPGRAATPPEAMRGPGEQQTAVPTAKAAMGAAATATGAGANGAARGAGDTAAAQESSPPAPGDRLAAAPSSTAPPDASRNANDTSGSTGPTRPVTPAELFEAAEVTLHTSALVRGLLMVVGSLCVLLGIIGLFLPLMPTTPFMLLAAACYARASSRFYGWLITHRLFGPPILEWRRHRAIPYRAKQAAVLLMAISFSTSILLVVRNPWWQAGLGLFALLMCGWLWRLPSRDAPGRSPPAS